jgi:hypothetical protein
MSAGAIRRAALVLLFNLAVASVLLEAILAVAMSAPAFAGAMPRPVRRVFQQVYRHFNRSLIQFEPACAQYDPGLTYTLKPGTCTFANVEFSNGYRINRLGLRDDEAALEAPEVIVLGDSYVMGWGVEQDETLPRVLARRTGRAVLNAGVSSYGTAREMKLLDRLDTSRLATLVVQYHDTDAIENWAFREHGGVLPIATETEYRAAVERYQRQRGYVPGKYLARLFMKLTRLEAPEPNETRMPPVSSLEEAELFLNALTHGARTPLDEVRVIVFEVNEQIRPARTFLANVAVVARRDGQPSWVRRLRALDVAPLLDEADFYDLDDHLRPHGHEVIGNALAEIIQTP